MNVVSLCSGVGLLDLGLEWAGMRTIQFCEIDQYATRVLSARYPGVPVHPDAWTIEPKECDVIAAGFPCQPFSVAGKRLGDKDPRHLWPAIFRSIRMARPRYVILENVPGLVTSGIGDVLGDLAGAGFDAEWTVFSAADVGAPHLRRRWWCVATPDPDRSAAWDAAGGFFREAWATSALAWAHGTARPMADTDGQRELQPGRFERSERGRSGYRGTEGGDVADTDSVGREGRSGIERTGWRGQPPDSGSADGWWSTERGLGRVAHRQPNRMDRLRCLGNGVVPQCAELVGLRLMQLDWGTG